MILMKNVKNVFAIMLTLAVFALSIVGCSNGDNAASESNDISNTESSITSEEISNESSEIQESSEKSYEVSSEIVEDSDSETSLSSKPGIDKSVEERSYDEQEKYKLQATKFADYKYYPAGNSYVYSGTAIKVTIPSEFTECPGFNYDNDVKEIILPETVTKIPARAFEGCRSLEKLVILNPNCSFDMQQRILPLKDNNNRFDFLPVDLYFYFNSDKTHPEIQYNSNSNVYKYFAHTTTLEPKYWHDLAIESYE